MIEGKLQKDLGCAGILEASSSYAYVYDHEWASQVTLGVENPPANVGDMRPGFDLWVGKIPWRRTWQPTPVFLPGESHGQRSLPGYSPWGCRVGQADVTRHIRTHVYFIRLGRVLVVTHGTFAAPCRTL